MDKTGFSDVLVAHLREMSTTLFCLFVQYHTIVLGSLKGIISTATVVPTLPEAFPRGHCLSDYSNLVWSAATVTFPLPLESLPPNRRIRPYVIGSPYGLFGSFL